MNTRVALALLMACLSAQSQTITYYIQGLHRQANAQYARDYLGIYGSNIFGWGTNCPCGTNSGGSTDCGSCTNLFNLLYYPLAGNPSGYLTAPVANAALANSSVTYNGTTVALGASGTLSLSGAGCDFPNEGTTTTLLHGNAAGNLSFSAVDLANDVTGNLGTSHLNSGTGAGATTYWCGNGTWAVPSPPSSVSYATNAGSAVTVALTNKDVLFVSDRRVMFSTNFTAVGSGTHSMNLWLTNGFAGFDGQSLGGAYKVVQRSPGGDWSPDTTNILTEIGLATDIAGQTTPSGLTNLVIYSWTQPAVYHRTNSTYSQIILANRPRYDDQVATRAWALDMMNNAARKGTNWSRHPADSEIDTGTHPMRIGSEWEQMVTEGTNTDTLAWTGNGSNIWALTIPPAIGGPLNYHSFEYDHASPMTSSLPYQVGFDFPKPTNTVYSPSNMMVCLPLSWTSAPPRVLWSSLIKPDKWIELPFVSTWPGTGSFVMTITNWNLDPNNGDAWPLPSAIWGYQMITNTGILISFALPDKNLGNFKIATNTYTPPVGTLSGVLRLTPLPTIRSNSTTWGMVGLLATDGTNLLHAYGTNQWEKVVTQRAW